jgi:RHS repeat-associated protein
VITASSFPFSPADLANPFTGYTSSFSGNLGDGATRTYADQFSYNAAGQLAKERFGTNTPLYHNVHYNSRFQMVDIRLGTDGANEWTWNRGALIAYFSNQARSAGNAFLNATDNNGNVTMQEHYVPTDDAYSSYAITLRDTYEYDGVNRLTQTNGLQRTTAGAWNSIYAQWYNHDQWGNRTINTGATWGNAINNSAYTVSTSTNRVNGMAYDFAGNVTNDAGNAREYDGENRMKKAWGSSNWNYYVYDADGRRLRRVVGVTETWQVYGMGGELVAEYPVNGAANMPQKEYGYRDGQMLVVGGCDVVRWIVADHLGTPRIEVDPSGSFASVRRHDYLPFGEELTVGMGNGSIRTTGMGYPPAVDCVRHRFGSKERDTETGLDYFLARYYSSTQGRFTSPDPLEFWMLDDDEDNNKKREFLVNPQKWNKYTYVLNNPLKFVDPSGLAEIPAWSGLSKALQDDLAKHGVTEKSWDSWNSDQRQRALNARAVLIGTGAWKHVTSIVFGDLKNTSSPTFTPNPKGWFLAITTSKDIGPELKKAGWNTRTNPNHPENKVNWMEGNFGIVMHLGMLKAPADAYSWIHWDTGGGWAWNPNHLMEWATGKGGSTNDDVSRAIGGKYLKGISDSLDKALASSPPSYLERKRRESKW